MFNFLRSLRTVLWSGRTSLRSRQLCEKVSLSPRPRRPLSFLGLLTVASVMGVRWCLIPVATCISLMMSNVQHLFTCLLRIRRSSLKKRVCRSSAHVFIGFSSLLLSSGGSLHVLDFSIFSQSAGCLFILRTASFAVQEF